MASDKITRQQWKWSVLAGMASYLDAGSIVALGAGLALFQSELGLSGTGVGVLAAIGPNAIGCAIGAFVGGRLGDKLGRKRIYQYDLLVYGLGVLCIALAVDPAMLFIGTFVVGVAVGADVPTSLALVGELSPAGARGKLLGLTQFAWNTPYMVRTLGAGSQAASVALSCAGFVIGILVTVFVFMPFSDRGFRARKLMWGIGAVMQITAYATILRGTAQGFTFGVARVVAA